MPGTMFIQPVSLSALPTTGTAWDALVTRSNADPGTGNLGALDQLHPLKVFSIALRWAKDGGGLGKQYVIDEIKAVMGTETSASQPLNPYRTLGAYILAADLVDMPGSTVGANGQTFNAWMQSWPNKVLPGQTNWNTLEKCSRVSGNNWGACARLSLLAVLLWLRKEGLQPSGYDRETLIDSVIRWYKRWCSDSSVTTNTFVPAVFDSNKDGPNTVYPTSQGAINPASSDSLRDGLNCEDGSRDSGMPPTASGVSYQYESLDSCAVMIAVLINVGYTDAAGWGNSAVRRNVEWMIRNNRVTADQNSYRHEFWMQPWFWNHLYGLSMPIPPNATTDRYDRRMLTTHTDWLTSSNSTWLKVAGGGGTNEPPAVVNPTVDFTITVNGAEVVVNAAATTAGSAAITHFEITYGDGTATVTTYEPDRLDAHTYADSVLPATFDVRVKAFASDGGSASTVKSTGTLFPPNGQPIARLTLDKTSGVGPLTVAFDLTGSSDPDGDPLTYSIAMGDGTTYTTSTGTHTYAAVTDRTDYTVRATVTGAGVESPPVIQTVSVLAPLGDVSGTMYLTLDGRKVPATVPEVASGRLSAASLASAVGYNIKDDFGAVGDGVADDSAAFAAAATAAKNALRSMMPFQSDKSGGLDILIPPGKYRIVDPGSFLGDEVMVEKGVGLRWRGAGKSVSTIIFEPAAAGALATNDYWQQLQFQDLGFIATTAGCTFLLSSTTHNAQAYSFTNCRWWNFKYVLDLQGNNNNSEHMFVNCDSSGLEAGGAFLYIGPTNTTDQFLNYWFFGCKHWSTSAPFIDAHKGGHFHIYGLDVSDWGAALATRQHLFKLHGTSHSRGVCTFEANGVRVEAKNALAALLYSEWGQGSVTFRSADWSSQVPTYTYGDVIDVVYANTDGAHYSFRDSVLAGGVKVKFATNDWVYDHAVTFDACQFLQRSSPSDVVSYDTVGNNNPLSLPPVDFVRCRGESTGNSIFDPAGMAVWDARIGYRGELLQSVTPRVVSVRSLSGTPSSGSTFYVRLPVGAIITGLQALSPAGTSAEGDGGSWALSTTEVTPTTIATATVTGAMSAGYDVTATPTVPFLCDTQTKALVKIDATNVTTENSGALLLIKGYW